MTTSSLLASDPLEKNFLYQLNADVSFRAARWFVPDELRSIDGKTLPLMTDTAEMGLKDKQIEITEGIWKRSSSSRSKTPMGRRLREIRQKIKASGQPLLDWDDIESEIIERRGGVR